MLFRLNTSKYNKFITIITTITITTTNDRSILALKRYNISLKNNLLSELAIYRNSLIL